MLVTLARLLDGYWLAPWRSPLLRWRAETYGVVDAQGQLLTAVHITPGRWLHFCWTERRALRRFLRWAATLPR